MCTKEGSALRLRQLAEARRKSATLLQTARERQGRPAGFALQLDNAILSRDCKFGAPPVLFVSPSLAASPS